MSRNNNIGSQRTPVCQLERADPGVVCFSSSVTFNNTCNQGVVKKWGQRGWQRLPLHSARGAQRKACRWSHLSAPVAFCALVYRDINKA